jgi:hypothetical protein
MKLQKPMKFVGSTPAILVVLLSGVSFKVVTDMPGS